MPFIGGGGAKLPPDLLERIADLEDKVQTPVENVAQVVLSPSEPTGDNRPTLWVKTPN